MQLVTALRDTLANAIDTDVSSATCNAKLWTNTVTGTAIATCNLSNPAFGTSSSGTITLSGTPQDTTPNGGTATRLAIYANNTATSGAWRILMGINTTGTTADVIMSNNVVTTSDTVQISSLTITVPAGTPNT